jgi:hypothetical protein
MDPYYLHQAITQHQSSAQEEEQQPQRRPASENEIGCRQLEKMIEDMRLRGGTPDVQITFNRSIGRYILSQADWNNNTMQDIQLSAKDDRGRARNVESKDPFNFPALFKNTMVIRHGKKRICPSPRRTSTV